MKAKDNPTFRFTVEFPPRMLAALIRVAAKGHGDVEYAILQGEINEDGSSPRRRMIQALRNGLEEHVCDAVIGYAMSSFTHADGFELDDLEACIRPFFWDEDGNPSKSSARGHIDAILRQVDAPETDETPGDEPADADADEAPEIDREKVAADSVPAGGDIIPVGNFTVANTTLKGLREQCKLRDLPVSGTKAQLIERLDEYAENA